MSYKRSVTEGRRGHKGMPGESKMKVRWIALGAAACIAVMGIVLMLGNGAILKLSPDKTSETRRLVRKNVKRLSPESAVRAAMPKTLPKTKRPRPVGFPKDIFSHLTGKDKQNAEAVQKALDANDLKATVRAATVALKSENPEVRQNAVEALGWFGAEALPELTACMADNNDDVRQSAVNLWEQAAQEIESPAEQLPVVMAAFGTLTDEEQLTSLGGLLSGAALQYIDGENDETLAAEKRLSVVQELVDIIEGENVNLNNVKAAKEVYNDITGHEWRGFDEAERYIDDPENYEDPES